MRTKLLWLASFASLFVLCSDVSAETKRGRKISVKSLSRTLSLKEVVSVRATTCALRKKKQVGTNFLSLTCSKKGKPTGSILQKSKKVFELGNKNTITIQSNRCDLLIRQASSIRYDISCQVSATPTPGQKTAATSTPTIKATLTKTPVPQNTATSTPSPSSTTPLVPTETPTITPTPTATPNAQILSLVSIRQP